MTHDDTSLLAMRPTVKGFSNVWQRIEVYNYIGDMKNKIRSAAVHTQHKDSNYVLLFQQERGSAHDSEVIVCQTHL